MAKTQLQCPHCLRKHRTQYLYCTRLSSQCSSWNIFTFYYHQYIFISYLLRTLKKCETRQLTTRASQESSKLEYPHAYITDYRAEMCIFYFNIHKYLGAYHYKKR